MRIDWKLVGFGVLCMVFIGFGVAMATYIVSGLLILGGFVALVEGIKPIRWIAERTTRLIDIGLFVASAVALVTVGTTVAVGLSIAGIGMSIGYGPFLRRRLRKARLLSKGLTDDQARDWIDSRKS